MLHPGRIFVFLLVLGLMVQGCAPRTADRPPPQERFTFVNGVLHSEYQADPLETYDASWSALRDFNMRIVNSQRDASGGFIEALHPDGRQVNVSFRVKGREDTTVGIRVGDLGDEELSRAIGRRIEAHLG